uniref:SJCHGC02817 protein n=1 Tax=Schistosoma japonicum TaxID=6182 RepID=Q5DB73_SCHJA|nr:SJCHGC02817 protein [Schistosoma japonicum]
MEFAHTVFRVALSGDASMLLQILSENPNLVNLPDFDGNMPLHFAAMSGSSECVKICISALKARLDLDCGTEVRRRNFMGKDALTISIEKGDYESFSLLLSAGAETDYRCTDDVPPLVAALSQDNVEKPNQLTANVLDTLEINFLRLRRDHYWILTLHTDLSISLIYLKLLKAHAVPYILSEFEEICATGLEKDHQQKGLRNS